MATHLAGRRRGPPRARTKEGATKPTKRSGPRPPRARQQEQQQGDQQREQPRGARAQGEQQPPPQQRRAQGGQGQARDRQPDTPRRQHTNQEDQQGERQQGEQREPPQGRHKQHRPSSAHDQSQRERQPHGGEPTTGGRHSRTGLGGAASVSTGRTHGQHRDGQQDDQTIGDRQQKAAAATERRQSAGRKSIDAAQTSSPERVRSARPGRQPLVIASTGRRRAAKRTRQNGRLYGLISPYWCIIPHLSA